MGNSREKVIVIVGPTGSGKTGVAVEIAKAVSGEIICADSRTIYKGMDVGTAKPTVEEMKGVPHFGLNLVEPGTRFTVADFKMYAERKIREIRARGHVPMVVGGTGLYIDALVYDYQFNKIVQKNCSDRTEMSDDFMVFGIRWEAEELRDRIRRRIDGMFGEKLYTETRKLVEQYGWGSQAMKSDVYQFAWGYMQGKMSLEKAKELAVYDDWHLAKRQMTWFKRNDKIRWLRLAEMRTSVIEYIQYEQRK